MELEDFEDLVDLAVAAEERLLLDQLSEDAADRPDVHSQAVLALAQQHLRRAVPKSFNFVCQCLDGDAKSAGKSKISDLEHS